MLIDVHTHIVPASFPPGPASGTATRWPCLCHHGDGRAVIEFAGKPYRELDQRSWEVARRLEDMEREGIAAQALSPMPELLSYWLDAAPALELNRWINHALAEMVARAPGRFHALGCVPLQDIELATRELARLKADGFAGVEIGSNINGAMPGEARFDPFYAEAERLDLAIFVHALHPVGVDRVAAWPDLVPFANFPLDTGLAAATLIRAGVPERYPRLRLGFSHGGGAIASLAARLAQGWRLSQRFGGTLAASPTTIAAGFYYDSLVYDAGYLDYLAGSFAPGQVFAGTDYPYVIQQEGLQAFLDGTTTCGGELTTVAARRFLGLG
ncbi:MAG: amidohydrolase family protein [Gammaproteobacteria bacterium]